MKILALSKTVFDRLMIEKKVTPDNVEKQDRILFISINEQEDNLTPEYHPYFPEDKKNVKVMHFSDVEHDMEVTSLDGSGRKHMVYAMTQEQAADLYSFIKNNIEGKEMVLIHCTLGVARSGAVAAFINDYVSGSWELFKRDNSAIQPNAHVYRLLHDEWYKDLAFPKGYSQLKNATGTIILEDPIPPFAGKHEFQIELLNPISPELQAKISDEKHGTITTFQTMTDKEIIERWGNKILKQIRRQEHRNKSKKSFSDLIMKNK